MNPTPPARAVPTPAELVEGRLMAQGLAQVLDRVRGARDVLPHLAALERSLRERGSGALRRIQPHWLPKICSQLQSLPLPVDNPPLQELQQRLLRAWADEREMDDMASGFHPERTVVIREVSHSEFEAASQEQATTMPGSIG